MFLKRLSAAGAILVLSLQLNALEIRAANGFVRNFDDADLDRLTYPILAGERVLYGVSLLELLPLSYSCDEVRVYGATSDETWSADSREANHANFADSFSTGFLYKNGARWDLTYLGRTISEVESIEIDAEFLDDRRLTIWTSWEGTSELKHEITRFAELHGCSIDSISVANTQTKLIAGVRAGIRIPDVVMVKSDYISELLSARALQPVDTLIGHLTKSAEAFEIDGHIWAAPFYFDAQVAFVNPEIFADVYVGDNDDRQKFVNKALAGTWTIEDMEEASLAVIDDVAVPMAWNAYSAYWFLPFLSAFGRESDFSINNAVTVDDRSSRKALEYLLDLETRGLFKPIEREAMISLFVTGDAGLILSGSYSIATFENLGIDFIVAPFPANDDTGFFVTPLLDYKGFAITRRARNPALARRLVQHLCGPGVQSRFSSTLSKLPAREDMWPLIANEIPWSAALAASADRGIPVPPDRGYAVYKQTMWKLLRLVFSGKMDVEEALASGQSVIDTQLSENNR